VLWKRDKSGFQGIRSRDYKKKGVIKMDKSVSKMYRIKELVPGIYGIGSTTVMSYLAVGSTGAMVVDTAYGFEDLNQAVREVTSLPVTVVNSHGHVDHTGGNFFFDGPAYLHEADRELYKLHNSAEMHRYIEKTIRMIQVIFFWRNVLPKRPEVNDAKREDFDNFHDIREGDRFDLGGLTAEIIEIPGHTQGSIAVLFPEKRLIITSDGANAGTWLFLPESTSLSQYAKSLHKLEKLEFDYILTGHSQQLFTKDSLKEWIQVAEHPDLEHAKPQKGNAFAPNVSPVTVWAVGDAKHKGASIMIDPEKIK